MSIRVNPLHSRRLEPLEVFEGGYRSAGDGCALPTKCDAGCNLAELRSVLRRNAGLTPGWRGHSLRL